jgi:hypothetical protein
MCRRYRAAQHGDAPRADVVRDITSLDKIRSAMPEGDAAGGGGTVILNICPIASGTWFTPEACRHLERTGQLPPDALITLIEPPVQEDEGNRVLAFPRLEKQRDAEFDVMEAKLRGVPREELKRIAGLIGMKPGDSPSEAEIEARVKALPRESMLEIAAAFGLDPDEDA